MMAYMGELPRSQGLSSIKINFDAHEKELDTEIEAYTGKIHGFWGSVEFFPYWMTKKEIRELTLIGCEVPEEDETNRFELMDVDEV